MAKMIKFADLDNETIHGGIMLDDGDVICGCCGGLIEADEFITCEQFKLLDNLDWVDLTGTILNREQ